jgi:hypothetical protein
VAPLAVASTQIESIFITGDRYKERDFPFVIRGDHRGFEAGEYSQLAECHVDSGRNVRLYTTWADTLDLRHDVGIRFLKNPRVRAARL